MRAGRFNGRTISAPHEQRGVVLLIALIILVAMTLAGIGMMRSVDTGSLIAGNLAFKQATLNASDAGTRAGFNALVSVANSGNLADKGILDIATFNNAVPCPSGATAAGCTPGGNINLPGYFASCAGGLTGDQSQCLVASNSTWWTVNANWNNAVTLPPVTEPNGGTIATVSYLIHRMCTAQGPSNGQVCQTSTIPATGCSKTQLLPCTNTSVFYRITSRSVGVRNTVTYTQTLVLIAQ